jgi:hypothetical protein
MHGLDRRRLIPVPLAPVSMSVIDQSERSSGEKPWYSRDHGLIAQA